MPIEDEWKFVIIPSSNDGRNLVSAIPGGFARLEQGYLGGGARVRKQTGKGIPQYWFGWKRTLRNTKVMEIEPNLSQADYSLLWPECERTLVKRRWLLPQAEVGGKWELDAFLNKQEAPCFWMAEVETVPNSPWIPGMPLHPLVAAERIWAVPQNHPAFSSYALAAEGGIDTALHIAISALGN